MCFGEVQATPSEFWTVRNLESVIATLRQDALLSATDLPLSAVRWTRSKVLRSHGRKTPILPRICLKHMHLQIMILKQRKCL